MTLQFKIVKAVEEEEEEEEEEECKEKIGKARHPSLIYFLVLFHGRFLYKVLSTGKFYQCLYLMGRGSITTQTKPLTNKVA